MITIKCKSKLDEQLLMNELKNRIAIVEIITEDDKISFENTSKSDALIPDIKKINVYLGKKIVGQIKEVKGGWQYFPGGSGDNKRKTWREQHQKSTAEVFSTLGAAKKSLSDDNTTYTPPGYPK